MIIQTMIGNMFLLKLKKILSILMKKILNVVPILEFDCESNVMLVSNDVNQTSGLREVRLNLELVLT